MTLKMTGKAVQLPGLLPIIGRQLGVEQGAELFLSQIEFDMKMSVSFLSKWKVKSPLMSK